MAPPRAQQLSEATQSRPVETAGTDGDGAATAEPCSEPRGQTGSTQECGDSDSAPDDAAAQPESPAGCVDGKGLGPRIVQGLIAGVVIVAVLGGLAGWFGYRYAQIRHDEQRRAMLVQVAKQGALNLTTIDFNHADADIKRVIDSATGTFLTEFQQRAPSFIDFVKQARSQTKGDITAAGLEAQEGATARVLVALAVRTSAPDATDQKPRRWRMRITVQEVPGGGAKVSNVEFVP